MDQNQARELLGEAMRADESAGISPMSGADSETGPSLSNTPDAGASSASEVAGTTDSDSFTKFDLNSVPEEYRPFVESAYKQFQGDYTRKTQDLAEQRKALEGLDPNAAREAIQFVDAIQNDPQYALAVHQTLTEQLTAAGYSPAQAQAEASRQLSEFDNGGDDWEGEDYGVVPPDVQRKLDELEAWKSQQEQTQRQQQWEMELTRQSMAIQQANPSYEQDDMDAIFQLSWSTNGDLFKAQQAYDAITQRGAQRYFAEKAGVPSGQPHSSGPAETPQVPKTMEEGHAMALEHWRQVNRGEL